MAWTRPRKASAKAMPAMVDALCILSMIVSGRKSRTAAAPARTVTGSGSGSTESTTWTLTGSGRPWRMSATFRTKPISPVVRSVTIVTRFRPSISPR